MIRLMTRVRPIRIAAQLHPQHGAMGRLLDAACDAEALGYDVVYDWDHFFPLYGPADGAHFEAMTTLAAWAARTTTIEIGTLVTCAAYRNADLLADMIRTIDHVAGGRVVLGLGAGWFERDFSEYGYGFGTTASRLAHLADTLARVRARLDRLNPAPSRPVPIVLGGTGQRRTLRLVAEHAQGWHAMFPDHAGELEPAVAALDRHCAAVGRDPGEIERGVGVEPDDLDRFLAVEADPLVELGFTQFTLGFNGPEWNVAAGRSWLEWRDARNGR
jgi:probable F420-dependent oxidoreductase